jgi:hypothetical protein
MAGFLRRLTSDAGRSNTDLNRQAQPSKPPAKSGTTMATPLYSRFASNGTSLNAGSTGALNSRVVSGPMPLNGNKRVVAGDRITASGRSEVPVRQVRTEESMPTGHNPADVGFQYGNITAIQNHSRKPSQTTRSNGHHTTHSSVTSVTTDKPLPAGPVSSGPSNAKAASTNVVSNNQTSMQLAHPSYLNKKPLPQPLPEPAPSQQTAPVRKPSFSLTQPRNIQSSPQAGPSNSGTTTSAVSPTSTGLSYLNPALMHDSKDEAAPAPPPNHRQEYTLSAPPPTSILPPARRPSINKNMPPPAPQLNPGNHNLSSSPPPSSLQATASTASLLDQRLKDRGLEPPLDSKGVSMFASGAFAKPVTPGRSGSIGRNGNLPKLDLGSPLESQYKVNFHSPFSSLVHSTSIIAYNIVSGVSAFWVFVRLVFRRQVFMLHIWLLQNVCEVVIDILHERNPHLLNRTLNRALQSKDILFTTSRPLPHCHPRP